MERAACARLGLLVFSLLATTCRTNPEPDLSPEASRMLDNSHWRLEAEGKVRALEFQPGGSVIDTTQPTARNDWRSADNRVTFHLDEGVATYEGEWTDAGTLAGTATNPAGETWYWRASRLQH